MQAGPLHDQSELGNGVEEQVEGRGRGTGDGGEGSGNVNENENENEKLYLPSGARRPDLTRGGGIPPPSLPLPSVISVGKRPGARALTRIFALCGVSCTVLRASARRVGSGESWIWILTQLEVGRGKWQVASGK